VVTTPIRVYTAHLGMLQSPESVGTQAQSAFSQAPLPLSEVVNFEQTGTLWLLILRSCLTASGRLFSIAA
jgi:hypothetical protein